jgi:hypothetical protein
LTEAGWILEELLSLVRDLAVLQTGLDEDLFNPDKAEMLRDVSRRSPDESGLRALEAVSEACGEVDSNVNLALIYATLFEALKPLGIH